ncbi:MAG: hypothetical protein HZB38_11695 [Planctomycetes bacterium]|nr:hypothetical protein [Planctomycetota bacterium]
MRPIILFLLSLTSRALGDQPVNYQQHIRPIFAERCLNCHNPDKMRGGLDLTSYAAAMTGASSGAVLLPGDADGSPLLGSVRQSREPKMPPLGSKLSDEAIELIRKWIAGGCLETPDGKPAVKAASPALAMPSVAGSLAKSEVLPIGLPLQPAVVTENPAAATWIAVHPWSPVVALIGPRQVVLYNTASLRMLGDLTFADGTPNSLRFTRGGHALVAGGGVGGKSGHVQIWDAASGKTLAIVGEEFDAVRAADVDARLRFVALGGPSKMLRVYGLRDGKLLAKHEQHTDWLTDIAFSPDGILLASADRNGGVFVFEAESRNLMHTLPAHPASITSLDWRDDSNILATACEDGMVRLWEMNGGSKVKEWRAHEGGVLCVRFAHDGRLVTCGRDKAAKLWNSDGAAIRALPAMGDIAVACGIDVSGKRVVVADVLGAVRVFDAESAVALGELATNPPSIDKQLATAQARLAAARTEAESKATAHTAAQNAAAATAEQQKAAAGAMQAAEQGLAAAEAALSQAASAATAAQNVATTATESATAAAGSAAATRAELDRTLAELKTLVDQDAAAQHELEGREKDSATANAAAERAEQAAAAAPNDAALVEAAKTARANAEAAKKRLADTTAAAADAASRVKAGVAATDAAKTRRAEMARADEAAQKATADAGVALAAAQKQAGQSQEKKAAALAAREQAKTAADEKAKAVAAANAQAEQAKAASEAAQRGVTVAEAEIAKWRAGEVRSQRDRLAADLEREQKAFEPTAAKLAAAQSASNAAAVALGDSKKRLESMPAVIQDATAKIDAATQAVAAADAEQKRCADGVQLRQTAFDAYAASVKTLAAQAAQAAALPGDAALNAAAAKAAEAVALLEQSVSAARMAAAQAAAALAAAQGGVKELTQAREGLRAEEAALPAKIQELTTAATTAGAALETEKTAAAELRKPLDAIEAQLKQIQQQYDQLLAAARPAYEG